MGQVLEYLEDREKVQQSQSPLRGLILATALFVSYLVQNILYQQHYNMARTVEVLVRGSLISAIFDKSIRLSPQSRSQFTTGQIQNLMSNDCRTIGTFSFGVHEIWSSVEQITIAMLLLSRLLGWIPTIFVLLFFASCIPVQMKLAATIKRLRDVCTKCTDERVMHISEAIKGIKILKLYSWELPFVKRILASRRRELDSLRSMEFVGAWNSVLVWSMTTLISMVAFGAYALLGKVLIASVIFPAIVILDIIEPSMMYLPSVVAEAARACTSLQRIRSFLLAGEISPLRKVQNDCEHQEMVSNAIALVADGAAFSWNPESPVPTLMFKMGKLFIPEGSLVAVVGPTGCGKSTFLAGFLGEVPLVAGSAAVRKDLSIAFCDQTPFIQNATLRENVLFGAPLVAKRYEPTLSSTALLPDIELLPGGDLTEIGSRGVNLSGGQRARVSLARAVYANRDITLLDDPLSAVDAHVGRTIFNECIVAQLRGKTRIMTTNQIQFAMSPEVDLVIVLRAGEVVEAGTRRELLEDSSSEFARLVAAGDVARRASSAVTSDASVVDRGSNERMDSDFDTPSEYEPSDDEGVTPSKSTERTSLLKRSESATYDTIEAGGLTRRESKMKGRVKAKYFILYLTAAGFKPWVFAVASFVVVANVFHLSKEIWLAVWCEQGVADHALGNILIYTILGLVAMISEGGASFACVYGLLRASRILHKRLLVSVVGAPISFFNSTPEGRLVNRFNSDMDKVDSTLAESLFGLWYLLVMIVMSVGMILWMIPVLIIFFIPSALLCLLIQEYYRKSIVDLRRLESISYSPLYSHFAEMLHGVVTIRAYNRVPGSCHENRMNSDRMNKTAFVTAASSRWLETRLNAVGSVLVFAATCLAVIVPAERISTSMKGLVLSNAVTILFLMSWAVKAFTETESQMSSVERISEYADPPFPQEAGNCLRNRLSMDSSCRNDEISGGTGSVGDCEAMDCSWLQAGKVEFDGVNMRYRSKLDLALENVSFSIQAGERVGIVGRSGAGKSSAIQCLFRLYEVEKGEIRIDGTDISTLALHDLRKMIGIIPQEPLCFSGTIRSNLDMFGECSDEAVQLALDRCGLAQSMREAVGLDFVVSENGSNLSVGQRQLLCLGRALLKSSRILVLDEATSSVSDETDEYVQRTLRELMGRCTMVIVAHRLHTVIRCDRIIVMDKGRVVEIGRPVDLLARTSHFGALVDESGAETAAHLRQLAAAQKNLSPLFESCDESRDNGE